MYLVYMSSCALVSYCYSKTGHAECRINGQACQNVACISTKTQNFEQILYVVSFQRLQCY